MTSAPRPPGQRLDLLAEAVRIVDDVVGAHLSNDRELLVTPCGGDDRGAHQLADVHGRQAHAAGAP